MIKVIVFYLVVLIAFAICANVSQIANTTATNVITAAAVSVLPNDNLMSIESTVFAPSPPSGSWQAIPAHELAGGIVRVSGDGPKLGVAADPRVDIGWDPPLTGEMIATHPNFKYLPPLSECGFSAILDEFDSDEEVIEIPSENTDRGTGSQLRLKRIIGGKTVAPQKHPWMVQLYLFNVSSGEHTFHCAGTLISNSTILTAAHCLTRLAPGTTMDTVVVGNVDRRKFRFCQTPNPEEECSRALIRDIDDIEVHDAYSEGNLNHDIALIYLRKPIKINANARPICLPFTSRLLESWSDLKMTGLGWGSTNKYANQGNYLSDMLKQVQFDLQPRSLCDKFHLRIYGRLKADRICTGGNTGRASCNGDSGGAVVKSLIVPDMEQGKLERVFQFGIVSAGGHPVDTCGFQGRPAIDTNVFYFVDWILNHITPGVRSYHFVRNNDLSSSSWVLEDTVDTNGVPVPEVSVSSTAVGDEEESASKYVNAFSTGHNVDVSQHPHIHILPTFKECGNLPAPPKQSNPEKSTTTTIKPEQTLESFMDPDGLDSTVMKRSKRIVGGVPVNIENFYPWMAQVYVKNVETDDLGFRCSGSIISKRHILTAAHCVTEIMAPFVFDSIVLGQYNRNATEECIDGECFTPQRVKIADVVVHSDYEKFTHKNNIALVRLNEDIRFSRMVQPICLPHRELFIEGIKVTRYFTVGWGRVIRENAGPSDKMSEILLQMYVDILPRRDCNFVYSRTIDVLDRSRICGGGKAGQGECLGDGGSPLMKKVLIEPSHPLHNKVFQLALVSFADCGMQGMPTVYMNVIYYMDWILSNLVSHEL